MVQVGQVRMAVRQRLVNVLVGMRLRSFVAAMRVPVMLVVRMPVRMSHPAMRVLVLVGLGEDEPGRERHQRRGGDQRRRHRLAEQRHRERGADERRGAEVRGVRRIRPSPYRTPPGPWPKPTREVVRSLPPRRRSAPVR